MSTETLLPVPPCMLEPPDKASAPVGRLGIWPTGKGAASPEWEGGGLGFGDLYNQLITTTCKTA